jgi:adenosine kinase
MLGVPGATAYMGCVGSDDFAKIMADAATADGVDVRYMVDAATPSGTCAVAVKGGERSLVANLAAANNYKIAHVKESANWALVDAARVVYSAGFFLTVAPDAMLEVAQACTAAGKTYCLNLSAPFLAQVPPFKKAMMDVMPHVSVLFGNETEARAFAESEGWATQDTQEIAAKIAALPKASGTRGRTVVITQGADATVVYENGRTHLVPVIPLAADKLVDTNGAGDAFVGGFLSQLVAGKGVAEACRAGNYAANVIIQRSGCTLPKEPAGFSWA